MTRNLPPFEFKKFKIAHDKCAMKVGVDGVLIGSWAKHDKPNCILDIGTGSGLIALMMQQRYPLAIITGIEPNVNSYHQALGNFENANFKNRPTAHQNTLSNFNPIKKFDIIVSNPPFFKEAVSSSNNDREQARQALFLPLDEIFAFATTHLSPSGTLNLVYPTCDLKQIETTALKHQLSIKRLCTVLPNLKKPSKRILIELSLSLSITEKETIIIETSRHQYSNEYRALTKDFYLNF
ncbi:MAG: tRNA1Val (adenine37-N6)-methyltransferase [Flavobacteriales bacterium]|jgi:tRNA1Val (adenine37-N6)-methyltransferase|tara:strand:- start:14563 stop:15276 length:714 start_codon:yes stop_codon:yes gene_type:complete